MSNESREPGFNLTSLRVADKNAQAAIEISKMARRESSDCRQRIVQLEAEVAALKQVVEQVRIQTVNLFGRVSGSGPTS